MRFHEFKLAEAPIADLATSPDTSAATNSSWRNWHPSDAQLHSSEKAKAKIYRVFEKTPFVFNFYLLMQNLKSPIKLGHDSSMRLSQAEVKKRLEAIMQKPIDTAGKITVCYSTNVAANQMPMNSWTLAHRIAHILQLGSAYSVGWARPHAEEVFWEHMRALTELTLFNDQQPTKAVNVITPNHFDSKFTGVVASSAMTQKSARDNALRTDQLLDFFGEIIAQYLTTGKFKLQNSKDFITILRERLPETKWSSTKTMPSPVKSDIDMNAVEQELRQTEIDVEESLDQMFESMKGKIFVF